jgi:hypothetical protein
MLQIDVWSRETVSIFYWQRETEIVPSKKPAAIPMSLSLYRVAGWAGQKQKETGQSI